MSRRGYVYVRGVVTKRLPNRLDRVLEELVPYREDIGVCQQSCPVMFTIIYKLFVHVSEKQNF
uniref:Uncharacterized protein n=1 Tax=Candidatus Kentrum sp. TUN TaxID=2126343 RepID=A0A450ZUY0_9GAMM|nr:MAG: hypothetical protein BECKTUN1418F_GA0071002_10471 [Candidatus Kentron sp. TUN]VFK57591.1 MAG: hypothetical protein BECKTUN1418E_GA0071001_10461 [Candidatus Kentron sp. TUN]